MILPILDVKTRWNLTLELVNHAYRLREFTCEWLNNPKYTDHRPLFTTQNGWTIVKYVMGVLMPFRYWTLRKSKRHTARLHHIITMYNDMFDHMDGVIQGLAHQQKIFPSGRNGSVRVDALLQSRQRHPGGGLIRARHQYHASRCISPSDRHFAVSSRSVGLLF